MDFSSLFVSFVVGLIGMGMLMYAKSSGKMIPVAAGLGLMILPYFVSGVVAQGTLCAGLTSLPFVFRHA